MTQGTNVVAASRMALAWQRCWLSQGARCSRLPARLLGDLHRRLADYDDSGGALHYCPHDVPSDYRITVVLRGGHGFRGRTGDGLVNEGLTLYMFEPDSQSGKSTCYAECENLWPPVLLVDGVKSPLAGSGVKASLLGTTVRTGGLEQITYNGWPLYLWNGDSRPGEANGQGLNKSGGLWYVLDPEGVPVTASA